MSRPSSVVATKKRMRKSADDLFSKLVRSRGHCEAAGFDMIECNGVLQCAHLVPRMYLSVRWDPSNAACLCAAHHVRFTHWPLEHEQFCIYIRGRTAYEYLKLSARQARGAPDYAAILEGLKEVSAAAQAS